MSLLTRGLWIIDQEELNSHSIPLSDKYQIKTKLGSLISSFLYDISLDGYWTNNRLDSTFCCQQDLICASSKDTVNKLIQLWIDIISQDFDFDLHWIGQFLYIQCLSIVSPSTVELSIVYLSTICLSTLCLLLFAYQ